jgi:hypothetical protein
VRKPAVGCPAPDFEQAHVRARDVLQTFLSPEQHEDFRRHQRFVTTGARTGHRYMITSRHARSELDTYHRTVYDLDEGKPYCVHDWGVPAAEEMLTMHLMLSLDNWELHLRGLREDGGHVHDYVPGQRLPQAKITPPPAHYYYDLNGCLRSWGDREDQHYMNEQGELCFSVPHDPAEQLHALRERQRELKRQNEN